MRNLGMYECQPLWVKTSHLPRARSHSPQGQSTKKSHDPEAKSKCKLLVRTCLANFRRHLGSRTSLTNGVKKRVIPVFRWYTISLLKRGTVLIIALLRVLHVYFFGSYCSKPQMDTSRISWICIVIAEQWPTERFTANKTAWWNIPLNNQLMIQ
jgi:hypothetical protein